MPCIFCQIGSGEVPGPLLHRDEQVFAIRDIHPRAPTHILIISQKHIPSLAEVIEGDAPLLGHMALVATHLARQEGLAERGYRLVFNCGPEGGQAVPHLHLHLLGGRSLGREG